jgi:hypothetical protein
MKRVAILFIIVLAFTACNHKGDDPNPYVPPVTNPPCPNGYIKDANGGCIRDTTVALTTLGHVFFKMDFERNICVWVTMGGYDDLDTSYIGFDTTASMQPVWNWSVRPKEYNWSTPGMSNHYFPDPVKGDSIKFIFMGSNDNVLFFTGRFNLSKDTLRTNFRIIDTSKNGNWRPAIFTRAKLVK